NRTGRMPIETSTARNIQLDRQSNLTGISGQKSRSGRCFDRLTASVSLPDRQQRKSRARLPQGKYSPGRDNRHHTPESLSGALIPEKPAHRFVRASFHDPPPLLPHKAVVPEVPFPREFRREPVASGQFCRVVVDPRQVVDVQPQPLLSWFRRGGLEIRPVP